MFAIYGLEDKGSLSQDNIWVKLKRASRGGLMLSSLCKVERSRSRLSTGSFANIRSTTGWSGSSRLGSISPDARRIEQGARGGGGKGEKE